MTLSKRKICAVITARPSYSRIKTLLSAIQKNQALELQLVVAASALLNKYGNVSEVIEQDGFKIDERIYVVVEGEDTRSMAKTTGLAVIELSTAFYNLKPDAVIVIADRFETIAVSIASSFQNIPLIHLQGGEVTGNIDEKVRHANSKLADIHFVSNLDAKNRLIKMGENPDSIHNLGCPSIDLAKEIYDHPTLDFDPVLKYGGVGQIGSWKKEYLVVMQHPVTTEYDEAGKQVLTLLNIINDLNLPTFWFWPNMDAGSDSTANAIRTFRETKNPKNILFIKNMMPNDFLRLIANAKCLIGNSSVGIRESSFLGVPVVNIGTRQMGRIRAENVIDVNYGKEEIKGAIIKHLKRKDKFISSNIYGTGSSGEEIAKLLVNVPLTVVKKITY